MTEYKTSELEANCPHCSYFMDRHSHHDSKPTNGDLSFCIKCGNVSEFNENLQLIKIDTTKLSREEQDEIAKVKTQWRAMT